MKNIAKLALFLSFSFIGILGLLGILSLLQDWVNAVLIFPPDREIAGVFSGKMVSYLESSFSAAFYISILLGLNYAVRRRIFYPVVFAVIFIFILILGGAVFFGLKNFNRMGGGLTIKKPSQELAQPGFILAPDPSGGNQTVFLDDPYKPTGSAGAVLADSKSLSYQEQIVLHTRVQLPFFAGKNGIFDSISRDFERSSRVFITWFNSGLFSYGVYAGTLAAFLISLGCLVNISFWSLANLFFGALAFRGVLALENFLNQPNIRTMLVSFAGSVINESLIIPLIFSTLCILILLYSGLIYLARGRISHG